MCALWVRLPVILFTEPASESSGYATGVFPFSKIFGNEWYGLKEGDSFFVSMNDMGTVVKDKTCDILYFSCQQISKNTNQCSFITMNTHCSLFWFNLAYCCQKYSLEQQICINPLLKRVADKTNIYYQHIYVVRGMSESHLVWNWTRCCSWPVMFK